MYLKNLTEDKIKLSITTKLTDIEVIMIPV